MATRFIRGWTPLPVPGNPRVSVVVATYQQTDELACLLYSFKAQTYDNWEAVVVHDGPGEAARQIVQRLDDPRVRLIETPERRGQYGHPWRTMGVEHATGDYIGLTNGDNYYVPVYFEWMLHVLVTQGCEFAYCDMVHSYARWGAVRSHPAREGLDLGAWIAEGRLVRATPWRDFGFAGDGTFIEDLLSRCAKAIHIPRSLFVHN
jgi:glycosyltransferase involved in cell wall biosynthesis